MVLSVCYSTKFDISNVQLIKKVASRTNEATAGVWYGKRSNENEKIILKRI